VKIETLHRRSAYNLNFFYSNREFMHSFRNFTFSCTRRKNLKSNLRRSINLLRCSTVIGSPDQL